MSSVVGTVQHEPRAETSWHQTGSRAAKSIADAHGSALGRPADPRCRDEPRMRTNLDGVVFAVRAVDALEDADDVAGGIHYVDGGRIAGH